MHSRMRARRTTRTAFFLIVCGSFFFCACGGAPGGERPPGVFSAYAGARRTDAAHGGLFSSLFGDGEEEDDSGTPREVRTYTPAASGEKVYTESGVTIDASHLDQGYVMIKSEPRDRRLKVRVGTEAQTYNYDLPTDGDWQVYSFQQGSGTYSVRVMENVEADLYAELSSTSFDVALADENLPFLYPNQYVMYTPDSLAVQQARILAGGMQDEEKIVRALYDYIGKNYAYDYEKAETVAKGYLPAADDTLGEGKGICFDFSVLLAVMCRAEDIPCKVVIGNLTPENILHAWNLALIDGAWQRFDATFYGDTLHRASDYSAERVY